MPKVSWQVAFMDIESVPDHFLSIHKRLRAIQTHHNDVKLYTDYQGCH